MVMSGRLRPDFTILVYELAFGTPKFYIAPYRKIIHGLINLSCNCDMKSALRLHSFRPSLTTALLDTSGGTILNKTQDRVSIGSHVFHNTTLNIIESNTLQKI